MAADFYLDALFDYFISDRAGGEIGAEDLVAGIMGEFGEGAHTGTADSRDVYIHIITIPQKRSSLSLGSKGAKLRKLVFVVS